MSANPPNREDLEKLLQEAKEALAEKVQEHRRAILKNKIIPHIEEQIEALRARIEDLKKSLEDLEPPEESP